MGGLGLPRQKAAQVAGRDTRPTLRDLRVSVVKLLAPARGMHGERALLQQIGSGSGKLVDGRPSPTMTVEREACLGNWTAVACPGDDDRVNQPSSAAVDPASLRRRCLLYR